MPNDEDAAETCSRLTPWAAAMSRIVSARLRLASSALARSSCACLRSAAVAPRGSGGNADADAVRQPLRTIRAFGSVSRLASMILIRSSDSAALWSRSTASSVIAPVASRSPASSVTRLLPWPASMIWRALGGVPCPYVLDDGLAATAPAASSDAEPSTRIEVLTGEAAIWSMLGSRWKAPL